MKKLGAGVRQTLMIHATDILVFLKLAMTR